MNLCTFRDSRSIAKFSRFTMDVMSAHLTSNDAQRSFRCTKFCASILFSAELMKVGDTRLEPTPKTSGNTAYSTLDDVNSDARLARTVETDAATNEFAQAVDDIHRFATSQAEDPGLRIINQAWPMLPVSVRQAMLSLVRQASKAAKG
jgi:thiamine biosynthesis lipoprotein ApbE